MMSINPLWDYSIATYSLEGVAPACLALQDIQYPRVDVASTIVTDVQDEALFVVIWSIFYHFGQFSTVFDNFGTFWGIFYILEH